MAEIVAMYEVMARRYRPGTFDEVVGQEHIAATLKNAISRDRVAHAYIFTGGHGCGKTTMARILAKALDCAEGPTPDPCLKCHICLDIAAGRDADVMEIDGASNNSVDQVRQLREQVAYVPTRARYKIYIIDEVHMLSPGAFNALLKTLEEPPRHVKFILATTDPHKVPNTILSRCQRFHFGLVPAAKLADFFRRLVAREKAAVSDDALDAIASFAGGSVRDGLVLLDQLLSFADGEVTRGDVEAMRGVAASENVAGLFEAVARRDVAAALAIADEVAARGASVGDFLDQLLDFGRDLMLFAGTRSAERAAAYGPAREALMRLGPGASLESALLALDVLAQARTRVRSRALTNPLVALDMAVARLAGLGGVTPVSELLGRLAALPPPRPPPAAAASAESGGGTPAPPPAVPETFPPPPTAGGEEGEPDGTPEEAPDDAGETDGRREKGFPPLAADAVKAAWERIIDALSSNHPADRRHMAKIAVADVRDGVIVLSGPPIAVEAWEDKHRLGRLRAAAAEILGRPAAFAFTVGETRPDRSVDEAAKAALARHPAVERIKDLFDGVVVECRPESPPEPDEDEE